MKKLFNSDNWQIIYLIALRGVFCPLLLFTLAGCGLMNRDTDIGAEAADSQNGEESPWIEDPVPYNVKIIVDGGPESLASKMKDLSQLEQLKKEPPDSSLALERRARLDQETAVKLLNSQCYYEGKAEIKIDENVKPALVTLTLIPGQIFNVGRADVIYEPEPVIPEAFKHRTRRSGFWGLDKQELPPPDFPSTIPGVEIGKPIIADKCSRR